MLILDTIWGPRLTQFATVMALAWVHWTDLSLLRLGPLKQKIMSTPDPAPECKLRRARSRNCLKDHDLETSPDRSEEVVEFLLREFEDLLDTLPGRDGRTVNKTLLWNCVWQGIVNEYIVGRLRHQLSIRCEGTLPLEEGMSIYEGNVF